MRTAKLAASVAALLFAVPALAQSEPTAPFNTPTKVGGWTLTPGNLGCTIQVAGPARLDRSGDVADATITINARSDGRYDLSIFVSRAKMQRFGGMRFVLAIGSPPIPLSGRNEYGAGGDGGRFTATLDSSHIALFDAPMPVGIHITEGTASPGPFVTLGMPALPPAVRALPLCRPAPNLKASARFKPGYVLREGDLDEVRGASKAKPFEMQLDYSAAGKVTRCTVQQSSGKKPVDARICELLQQRASFFPATDANGSPVAGGYLFRGDPKTGLSRTFVPRDDD
ncbi:MAG: hypothetical protein EOP58_14765 [Sphingomonadales bacterium]|nr:MAG: hypothetical protein EOP58_14765 [Sphingomonadales bacterium]